jgi:hypothetical protein
VFCTNVEKTAEDPIPFKYAPPPRISDTTIASDPDPPVFPKECESVRKLLTSKTLSAAVLFVNTVENETMAAFAALAISVVANNDITNPLPIPFCEFITFPFPQFSSFSNI